jgi:predicted Ser/Thr protein kinase
VNNDARIAELLLDYQDAMAQGLNTTIEELCATCPELCEPLRQQVADVESMLGWLDETVTGPEGVRWNMPTDLPHVPGYDIEKELGRGGMGVVYLARQVRANRPVALKMILSGGHASSSLQKRFRIEAEAVAQLQHPNIVQVYDVGESAGQPYFAFEYCPGGTLAAKLAGTPLPALEAAQLAEKLAQAMAEAHAKGVLHRDLKPSNIMLSSGNEPKISDFGLAKLTDATLRDGEASGITHSGALLGTPSYMAPEQAAGDLKRVGRGSDIYALGAILYECLTGRPPFKGASLADTLDQVRREEPVAPSQLNAAVPRDLEIICLKCLRKEPEQRYLNACQLAADLIAFRENRPIQARPLGVLQRTARWCRRNRAVAALLGAVFTLLVAGTIVSSALAIEMKRAAREAQAANEAMKRAEARERETALRLVMFLKQYPSMIKEKGPVIIAEFLKANPHLSEDDVRKAFASAPEAGTQASANGNPNFLGD